ncbi:hypothetical protein [Pseudomonas brassicacearum]|uniref:hypothetical protein n=1 Tax=Pseudomonas brassicacearum TaxID=930166 RepID=UPI001D2DE464|nr:hypothetical protein [Pseudomonas brassicacearum]CAH0277267.1 hypothetical protein SRABI06_03840 [Pseudomonas brassicacearum]
MTLSLQDIKPEQVDALKKQSQVAFDEQIKRMQALVSEKPALQEVLDQKVHPKSLCGCGCSQNICGYFCFEGCGSSCYPHSETIQITASPAVIGPDAPQQGTRVRFVGYATGTGTNVEISNLYLQGSVPDAENLVNVPLSLQLTINQGSLSLYFFEGTRLLAVMLHPSQYASNISGEFSGTGSGTFQLV